MTKAEVIELLRPKIQAKGASSGTVVLDLSKYSHFTISAAADIGVTLSNPATPCYVTIELTHTNAGTIINNLPGLLTWDFSWATNAGDLTVLGGMYNGTNWTWQSTIYQSTPTLSAPGSFTATPGDTQNALSWTGVSGATAYVVDRATNSGFTTGVTNGIYSGSGMSYTDGSLTNGTTYYYRIRSTGAGYLDSSYATANGTPASPWVTWNSLESGLEVYNSSKGVRVKASEGATWGNHMAWSNEQLTTGRSITIKLGTTGYMMFGLNATRGSNTGDVATMYSLGVQPAGNYLYTPGSTDSGIAGGNAGDFVRLRYASGTVTFEISNNGGTSYTTIHAFSASGAYYFGVIFYGNNSNEGFDEVAIA